MLVHNPEKRPSITTVFDKINQHIKKLYHMRNDPGASPSDHNDGDDSDDNNRSHIYLLTAHTRVLERDEYDQLHPVRRQRSRRRALDSPFQWRREMEGNSRSRSPNFLVNAVILIFVDVLVDVAITVIIWVLRDVVILVDLLELVEVLLGMLLLVSGRSYDSRFNHRR